MKQYCTSLSSFTLEAAFKTFPAWGTTVFPCDSPSPLCTSNTPAQTDSYTRLPASAASGYGGFTVSQLWNRGVVSLVEVQVFPKFRRREFSANKNSLGTRGCIVLGAIFSKNAPQMGRQPLGFMGRWRHPSVLNVAKVFNFDIFTMGFEHVESSAKKEKTGNDHGQTISTKQKETKRKPTNSPIANQSWFEIAISIHFWGRFEWWIFATVFGWRL